MSCVLLASSVLRLTEHCGQRHRGIIAAWSLMNVIKRWFVLKRGHFAQPIVAFPSAEL